jgi:predicted Rossmann fold flavoprotein
MSHQASCVVDLLVHEARELGVQIFCEHEVQSVEKKGSQFCLHVKENVHHFDACVIASGGVAWKSLGSSGSGYLFAKALGHRVIEPYPSLVQLLSNELFLKEANGVKMEAYVELFIEGQKAQSVEGDVLFTDYGLSGSAILEISRKASYAFIQGKEVFVVVDLLPTMSKDTLNALLQKRLTYAQNKSLCLWLEGLIPKKLALFLIRFCKLEHIKHASMLGVKEIKKLTFSLKAIRLHVSSTKGFESAEVCAGGVDVKELDEKTLMSKKVKHLYFCGEVLDIDGDCGGFNLHFAWSSGYIVGQSLKE